MTSKEQIAKANEIRSRYTVGDCLIQKDFEFMLSIFKQNDKWDFYNKFGVNNIMIVDNNFGDTCFAIVDELGLIEQISVNKSLRSKEIPKRQQIYEAGRTAVISEVQKVKRNVIYGQTKCALTGETLLKGQTEIDHYRLKFSEMFKLWLNKHDINKIRVYRDRQQWRFEDHLMKLDFIRFHNQNCNLRAVTKDANRGRENGNQ